MDYAASLIQTKLNRPPLPADLVPRTHLIDWLSKHRNRPLTLVSAPAGYGKSTLISCWLESLDCPTTWVSLDEQDNELGVFLSYLVAAIQKIFPDSLPETQSILTALSLPPVSSVAKLLINELNRIETYFILVLDDYHLIESRAVHDLMDEVLLHPPGRLHMVFCTRMDPLLSLVTMRAKSQVTEVRTQDMRFNQEETGLLLQKMTGISLDQAALSRMDNQTEGWVTGLRLAALAMRHRIGLDSFHGELSVSNRYVTEYLVTEILAKQSRMMSDCMLRTSILDRFCSGLCEALCHQDSEGYGNGSTDPEIPHSGFDGKKFLEWLQASNLFVVPLDDHHEWFRFHNLFRDFLQQELVSRLNSDEISRLHSAAGRWYAKNGLIEEALHHLLAAGDTSQAIELVSRYRYEMMNSTRWQRLERWLNLFPVDVVETSSELWILQIWLLYYRAKYADLPALLEHLDVLVIQESGDGVDNSLHGEVHSLHSAIAYYSGDAERSVFHARAALDLLSPESWIVRVMARMYLGGSLLLMGDTKGAYFAYYGAFEEEQVQNTRFKATLLMTACYYHWVTGDLQSMVRASKQSIALCLESGYQKILGQSKYHLGCVNYQHNNLPEAEELFSFVVSKPYTNYGIPYINSVCGLAKTYQVMGRAKEANQVVERAIDFLMETGNTTQMPVIQALQAELSLAQGRISSASLWADKFNPVPPLSPMPWFLAPHLTLVKILIAQNTPGSNQKAGKLLNQLEEYLNRIHNTRFLIETLALRALQELSLSNQPDALLALEKALRLGKPGGFIRVFVDLDSKIEFLLSQLKADGDMHRYVQQIRSAFPEKQSVELCVNQEILPEQLTNRELQILELLGDRLTNKEIASRLVISPGTVKGHTIHIYQKLDVKNRRQAVEKAIALKILSS